MYLTSNKKLRQFFGVLETGNLLFLKLFLRNRKSAHVFPNLVFRDYMLLAGKEKWACKDIFRIFNIPPGTRITVEHMPGEGVGTSVAELGYLALITRALCPKLIFEIGTFRGRTALNFALNSPDDCKVYTLDLPPAQQENVRSVATAADAFIVGESRPGIDFAGKDVAHKIQQLYGNSLEFDFAPYVGQMDIVFVDGAHHYAAVQSDTKNALRLVKPGGAIVWHDFANYGDYNDVTRGILDLIPGDQVVQIGNTELAVYLSPAA